jgi:aminoglycoside phosphotransferase (APT) family kinase protein
MGRVVGKVALASVGIPVPRMVLFETDPSLIGSPFFVGTASVR